MNKTAFVRHMKRTFYNFKRMWPTPIQLHQVSGEPTTNYDTGEIERNEESIKVKRAVMLPRETARKFVYDLAYIASSKNFTQGAFFDQSSRFILVDQKDLPKGYEVHSDDEMTLDNERYQIEDFIELPYKVGYIIHGLRSQYGDRDNDSY